MRRGARLGKGQVTIPKPVRDHLGVHLGGKLRFKLVSDQSAVITPTVLSVRRLFGKLGKPPRSLTLAEMDEVIQRAVS